MSHKKQKKSNVVVEKKQEAKWRNISWIMMWGLIISIPFCLLCTWISGETGMNPITKDNFLNVFIQNYNYILVAVMLMPVIAYLYSKIKKELDNRFVTDEKIFTYGFFVAIMVLCVFIFVCSAVYPINSWSKIYEIDETTAKIYGIEPGKLEVGYGINSEVTVFFFLIVLIVLITFAIICGILKISSMLKNKGELWSAIKKYFPIILMVMFLIWTFISCVLAPEAAQNVDIDSDEVLSKTFNGCYNLKDGFWAFLMYGSVMVAAMLISKDKVKEKKMLITGFVAVVSVLSLVTLIVTNYYNSTLAYYKNQYKKAYDSYYTQNSGDYSFDLTYSDFMEKAEDDAQAETYGLFNRIYIHPQRGVFRNSNHFAYVLCMAILASAVLAMIDKNLLYKFLYIIAFTIMSAMLIINRTFGAYLGVLIALICLLIYSIAATFVKNKNEDDTKNNRCQLLVVMIIISIIFTILSLCITNSVGNSIAVINLKNFAEDIGIFGGYMLTEENPTEADISKIDSSITDAGSKRGATWIKVWELIKQRPMFGYGLECLLFQFNGQFGVNEGRTHNLLLQLLATVGIPGTVMYFAALAIVFIRLLKNWKTWDDVEKICVFVGIAYMITALTGNSTYYTSPYFMMFLGFVVLTPWSRKEMIEENNAVNKK